MGRPLALESSGLGIASAVVPIMNILDAELMTMIRDPRNWTCPVERATCACGIVCQAAGETHCNRCLDRRALETRQVNAQHKRSWRKRSTLLNPPSAA